jgi:hypothetical protein
MNKSPQTVTFGGKFTGSHILGVILLEEIPELPLASEEFRLTIQVFISQSHIFLQILNAFFSKACGLDSYSLVSSVSFRSMSEESEHLFGESSICQISNRRRTQGSDQDHISTRARR